MSTHVEEDSGLRRGPWTAEEDTLLTHYIDGHGAGRWNMLAKCAGLKRTGKSCRLRWLNYLNPDVKRGNLSLDEQIMILELHSQLGNRWSKIAEHLPGRTDNEIKNYWRTRVQKQTCSASRSRDMSSRIPECMAMAMVPSLSTFPDSFVAGSTNTLDVADRFGEQQASPNVYDRVLDESFDVGSSGQDMGGVGEGCCWICDGMADGLWQCGELGEMGK